MKYRLLIIASLIVAMAIPACKTTEKTAKGKSQEPSALDIAAQRRIEALYVEACVYQIRGEYEKAEQGFREVLKSDPANHAAMFNISKLAIEQRNFSLAIEYGKSALKLDPENYWYYDNLRKAYQDKGDFENAIAIQEQALKKFPDKNEERLKLARLYSRAQQYDKAIDQLNTLEERYGKTPESLTEKLRLYLRTGRQEEALAVIGQLIDIDPTNERYYELQYETMVAIGKKEEAVALLKEMLEKNSTNGFALLNLAEYYKDQNDLTKSDEYLFRAFEQPAVRVEDKIRITRGLMAYADREPEIMPRIKRLIQILEEVHPGTGRVYAMKGDLFAREDKTDSARVNYRKALSLDGSNQGLWLNLLLSDSQSGDNEQLYKDAQEALEFYPNQVEFLYFFGTSSEALDKTDRAIYAFEKIKKVGGGNTEFLSQALLNLGSIYHEQEKYEKSDENFQAAIDLDEDNPLVLNNYAYFLALRKDQLDKAEEMISKAVRLQPGQASFEDTYGWVLYQQGKYEEAASWIEKALSHGDDAELHEHYGDVLYKLGKKDLALQSWQKAIDKGASFQISEKTKQP